MMKYAGFIGAFLVLSLLFTGCVSQPQGQPPQPKEQLAKELQNMNVSGAEDLIKVSGDENQSVVTIQAKNVSGRMLFPMKDYEGQFESLGLYSDAFVMLNKTQISWLDDSESIWITVYRGNDSGVLFNAIYENDEFDCGSGKVMILGKEYPLSELKNGSSFLLDDKWKVALEGTDTCPKRIVIFLDGYFDRLKDNETISLFRNDNAVLLRFRDLDSEPKVQVIATRPVGSASAKPAANLIINSTFIFTDEHEGKNYVENIELGENGLRLSFRQPIPVCEKNRTPCDRTYFPETTESHRIFLSTPNGQWVIVRMMKNSTTEELVLGKEIGFMNISPYTCENETIATTEGNWGMADHQRSHDTWELILENLNNGTKTKIATGSELHSGNEYIHVWEIFHSDVICFKGARISIFSDVVDLAASEDVMFEWENETSDNPALKSVFIPRSSPIFSRLMAGGAA